MLMYRVSILFLLFFTASPAPAAQEPQQMIEIEAGEFTMGWSDPKERSDYSYDHKISLDTYWISKFEVTNKEYGLYLEDTAAAPPAFWQNETLNAPDQPVVGVSWFDARKYCKWLSIKTGKNYAIPTEAQWEKAARGKEKFIWPWGDTFKFICHTSEKRQKKKKGKEPQTPLFTTTVNLFPLDKSPYGVTGMGGNVSEWVYDWYDYLYYRTSPKRNPQGPKTRTHKVIRGGSFIMDRTFARTFNRFYDRPDAKYNFLGFRIVRNR